MDSSILSHNLRDLRSQKSMTQRDFSQFVGITQQTLSGYENNKMTPSLDALINISQKCNVSLDWLCGISDGKSEEQNDKFDIDFLKTKRQPLSKAILELLGIIYTMDAGLDVQDGIYNPITEGYDPVAIVYIHNETIVKFLHDYQQLRKLYEEKVITGEMLNDWTSGRLEKLSHLELNNGKAIEVYDSEDDLPF